MKSTPEQILKRVSDLKAVAEYYSEFPDFYYDCSVTLLGFVPTKIQMNIADYAANGNLYSMIQAQRGEAKTTITGCYAVWNLIHDAEYKILITSAGTPMAKQISTWCIQIINGMDVLECLRPDKSYPGTRTSVEQYDVHHDLRGSDKSPSIACLGITSNMQGYRAHLLIADDVESGKNSRTMQMREILRHQTRDFTSINKHGQIIYLGTPQSVDSIYNDLPARGFTVRIWPGRIPTIEEESNYGEHLAPIIRKMMEDNPMERTGYGRDGDRGAPTDPDMMSEDMLVRKEIDQGKAYFNLQFMLDTALSDADRYPLKLNHLMFYSFDREDSPDKFIWSNDPTYSLPRAVGSPLKETLYRVASASKTYLPYTYKLLAVDPAGGGQNGDETGLAVVYCVNGYFIVMESLGIPGGTEPGKLQQIVDVARKWGVTNVLVEKNFGFGAYTVAIQSAFLQAEYDVGIEEIYAHGQKEQRIIDTLEPVIGSHRLLFNHDIPEKDVTSTEKYSTEKRATFQLLFQMRYITRDQKSLQHEDRLDALALAIAHLQEVLKTMKDDNAPPPPTDRFQDFRRNQAGIWRFANRIQPVSSTGLNVSIMQRFRK